MLRSFLPVGQGAFYVEAFKDGSDKKYCVYDCGSSTGIEIIENQIKSTFSKGDEIEYVFISHVDFDHINGLESLLDYCHVKNLIMPYTKQEDRYLLKLDLLCSGYNLVDDSFLNNFIDDPVIVLRQIEPNATVWFVREPGDEISAEDAEFSNDRIPISQIQSGTNILDIISFPTVLTGLEWEYVPYNFREDERGKQFRTELEHNIGELPPDLNKNLAEIWKDAATREKIMAAYKKVEGSLNTNSMVLFSGIRAEWMFQKPRRFMKTYYGPYCCETCPRYWCEWKSPEKESGCLYTGDYEAKGAQKWQALYNAYQDYWKYIGCVQLPHHGSQNNYNASFADLDAYFVISAGSHNKYQHPNSSVCNDLFMNHKPLSIVTEERYTELVFDISPA